MQAIETARKLLTYLQDHFNGCGWFTGTPELCLDTGNHEDDDPRNNELVEPGTEHEHILPCSNPQLLEWIDEGKIQQGEVVLILSRADPDNYFADKVGSKYRYEFEKSNDEEKLKYKFVVF